MLRARQIEFPKWLNAPETQAKLHGKQVLMYCTGGIRCERASALLDALARTSDGSFEVKDTVMVRGGIERYMKTFPEGGYWKGKNYLFDRRLEQVPEAKSETALAADVESYCCVCRELCGYYRGQYTCAGWLDPTRSRCGVPVIVCQSCALKGPDLSSLRCPLCEEGYVAPQAKPNLLALKQVLASGGGGELAGGAAPRGEASEITRVGAKRARQEERAAACAPSTRLFVGNLPFVVNATELRGALLGRLRGEVPKPPDGTKAAKRWRRAQKLQARGGGKSGDRRGEGKGYEWGDDTIVCIRWLTDRSSGLFYGSAFVEVRSLDAAKALVEAAGRHEATAQGSQTALDGGIKLQGRRLRVHYSSPKDSEVWPPPPGDERERPPVGLVP